MSTTPLGSAVDALYVAFESYARPETFLACGCGECFEGWPVVPGAHWNDTQRPLVIVDGPGEGQDLHQLDAHALAGIVWNVPLTGGSADVLKHYLPRIFEIVSAEDYDAFTVHWPDIEIVVSRIAYAGAPNASPWWTWPEDEQTAIREFFDALWLRDRAETHDADDTLCALGRAVPDIEPYLQHWSSDDRPSARTSLRDFRESNAAVLEGGTLWNAYWDDKQEPTNSNRSRVTRWVREAQPQGR